MMCISDGCDPHHYIKGRGMIGGMIHPDINIEEKLDDEYREQINEERAKEDEGKPEEEKQGNVGSIPELVEILLNDERLSKEEKRERLLKWEGDLEQIRKMNLHSADTEFEGSKAVTVSKKQEPLHKVILEAKRAVNKALGDRYIDDYEYPHLTKDTPHGKQYINPTFDLAQAVAKSKVAKGTVEPNSTVDTVRGDLTEEYVELDPKIKILKTLDHDKSVPLNSKNSDAYNEEYVMLLLSQNNNDFDKVQDILSHFPIDIIKNNTIWEIKSFKELSNPDTKRSHEMSVSKIAGYGDYSFRYINTGTEEKPKYKLDNIYYKVKEYNPASHSMRTKYIPTLPIKTNGYDYYWLMNNKDRIAYTNPLANKRFQYIPATKKGEVMYHVGDWSNTREDHTNKLKERKIDLKNTEMYHLPTRYAKEYSDKIKTIKKYKVTKK